MSCLFGGNVPEICRVYPQKERTSRVQAGPKPSFSLSCAPDFRSLLRRYWPLPHLAFGQNLTKLLLVRKGSQIRIHALQFTITQIDDGTLFDNILLGVRELMMSGRGLAFSAFR